MLGILSGIPIHQTLTSVNSTHMAKTSAFPNLNSTQYIANVNSTQYFTHINITQYSRSVVYTPPAPIERLKVNDHTKITYILDERPLDCF